LKDNFDLVNKFKTKQKLINIGIAPHDGLVTIGVSPHGIISIGAIPHGLISIGLVPMGVISIGLVSMGLLSVGTVSMGVWAVGKHSMSIVQPNGAYKLAPYDRVPLPVAPDKQQEEHQNHNN
jgi:hypothetical protein